MVEDVTQNRGQEANEVVEDEGREEGEEDREEGKEPDEAQPSNPLESLLQVFP